jgi:hypothetical protein
MYRNIRIGISYWTSPDMYVSFTNRKLLNSDAKSTFEVHADNGGSDKDFLFEISVWWASMRFIDLIMAGFTNHGDRLVRSVRKFVCYQSLVLDYGARSGL